MGCNNVVCALEVHGEVRVVPVCAEEFTDVSLNTGGALLEVLTYIAFKQPARGTTGAVGAAVLA